MSDVWEIDRAEHLLPSTVRDQLRSITSLVEAMPVGGEVAVSAKFHAQLVNAFKKMPHWPGDPRRVIGMRYRGRILRAK